MKKKIPPQIGWGKINSGQRYHVITTDLDRAFCALKWRAFELRLFQYIREACWGWSQQIKKGRRTEWTAGVVCQLSLRAVARELQIDYGNLCRAYRNMVEDNILVEHGDGIVSLNKNIDAINPDRFEPGAIAYAKAAWPTVHNQSVGVTGDAKLASRETPKQGHSGVTGDATREDTSESSDQSAFIERNAGAPARAELNSNSQRNTKDSTRESGRQSACARVREEPEETLCGQGRRLLRGGFHSPTILDQVEGATKQLLKSGYTPEQIAEAFSVAARTRKRIRNLPLYLGAIMDSLRQERESGVVVPAAVPMAKPEIQDSAKPRKKLPSIKELAEAARTMTFGDMDEVPF